MIYIITDLHISFDDKFQLVKIPPLLKILCIKFLKFYWSISTFLPYDDVMVTSYVN